MCVVRLFVCVQVEVWLRAVLGDGQDEAVNCILTALNTSDLNAESESSSLSAAAPSDRKRKYPDAVPSFFGSTTVANRNRRLKQTNSGAIRPTEAAVPATQQPESSCGKRLIILNIDTLERNHGAVEQSDSYRLTQQEVGRFKEARKVRMSYEEALEELHRMEENEKKRLRSEGSTRQIKGREKIRSSFQFLVMIS